MLITFKALSHQIREVLLSAKHTSVHPPDEQLHQTMTSKSFTLIRSTLTRNLKKSRRQKIQNRLDQSSKSLHLQKMGFKMLSLIQASKKSQICSMSLFHFKKFSKVTKSSSNRRSVPFSYKYPKALNRQLSKCFRGLSMQTNLQPSKLKSKSNR